MIERMDGLVDALCLEAEEHQQSGNDEEAQEMWTYADAVEDAIVALEGKRGKLENIRERADSVRAYLSGTIAPGGYIDDLDGEWVRVHKGRAHSAMEQMRGLVGRIDAALAEDPTP